ncbi:hypothetical protein AB6A40_005405, partial [Gnathostoma spinigerum]
MIDSSSEEDREGAEELCRLIIQMEEYRDLSVSILRHFNPAILSKTLLRDLIVSTHFHLRIIEKYSKAGKIETVQKKQKVRKKRKRINDSVSSDSEKERKKDYEAIWNAIAEEVSDLLYGYESLGEDQELTDVILCDREEKQQHYAMAVIRGALIEQRAADAVGMYRKARQLWMVDNVFGSNDMNPEEEFLELRSVFFSDLDELMNEWNEYRKGLYGMEEAVNAEVINEEDDNDGEDYESEEENHTRYITKQIEFSFNDYVAKFSNSGVLKWYVFLLSDYERNPGDVNMAILKLLHRIAFDLDLGALLFQLSLFVVFDRVGMSMRELSKAEAKSSPHYKIYEFGYHLLKRFFKRLNIVGS